MEMQAIKSQQERLKEAIEIRKQLEILGALIPERNREILKEQTNAFVLDGVSSTFILIVDQAKAKVVYSCRINGKSGVVLETPAPSSASASRRGKIL